MSKIFEVIVPVFLKVAVSADDELHAEVLAQEAARAANAPQKSGSAIVQFHSLLVPIVR